MADRKKAQPNTPEEVILRRRRRLRDRALLVSALQKLAVLALVIVVLFGFVFGLTPMKGGDMEPKLSAGDLLLYYRMEKEFARDEIVVVKRDGKQYVGRLVGLPEDTVLITDDGVVTVNGNNIYEENIFYETKPYKGHIRYPVVLGENEYFVLSDKRDTAKDSRYFGPVKAGEIKGKVVTVIKKTDL